MMHGHLSGQLRSSLLKKVQDSQAEFSTKESKDVIDEDISTTTDKTRQKIERNEPRATEDIGSPLPLSYLKPKTADSVKNDDHLVSKGRIRDVLNKSRHKDDEVTSAQPFKTDADRITTKKNDQMIVPSTFIRNRSKIYSNIAKMLEQHDNQERETSEPIIEESSTSKQEFTNEEVASVDTRHKNTDLSHVHTDSLLSEIRKRKERLGKIAKLDHSNYEPNCQDTLHKTGEDLEIPVSGASETHNQDDGRIVTGLSNDHRRPDVVPVDINSQKRFSVSSTLAKLKENDPFESLAHDYTSNSLDVGGADLESNPAPGKGYWERVISITTLFIKILIVVLIFLTLSYLLSD